LLEYPIDGYSKESLVKTGKYIRGACYNCKKLDISGSICCCCPIWLLLSMGILMSIEYPSRNRKEWSGFVIHSPALGRY